MQLLMTVHEYEWRFQVLKKAVSDGVLDDDGGEEPELETSERLSSDSSCSWISCSVVTIPEYAGSE